MKEEKRYTVEEAVEMIVNKIVEFGGSDTQKVDMCMVLSSIMDDLEKLKVKDHKDS